ncbi:Ig-like domain repeat protein [Plantactinospora sp. WMMB782]|uniref:Ig-like domain repeat protein n=1 Tax=Plantactinospora sp. WMMB782 TaxID=3404121 RepID=UPI003B942F17
MKMPIAERRLRRAISLLAFMSLGAGAVVSAPAAAAAGGHRIVEGATVRADRGSPTGYTVRFVYRNPSATQVRLAGDLTLLDVDTGSTRYQPEAWQTGRYHSGGTEFLRDMTRDPKGYWSVSVPLHAGALSYWYRVWDPTRGWENKRIWDPASTNPRPPGESSFRVRNNDVLDAVYVPYARKQNDPVLQERAEYELPVANPSRRGTVRYVPYTTILGDSGHHLGVYLPAGYDPGRAEPYRVAYLAHGIFGDETDFMVPANVPNILDNMTAKGEIEPTVVVTMGNHFTGTSLGFASYNQTNAADNLVQTILPLIESNYNVSTERAGRAYAGFSYGGMTGAHVIRGYPTTFAFYGHFSGNPSLSAQDYDDIANAVGDDDLFVFLGNGVFEGNLDTQNAIADNFRARGYAAATAQVPGAHDGMTAGQLFTIFARDHLWSGVDSAPGTARVVVRAKAAPASVVRGGTFTLRVEVRPRTPHRQAPKPTGEVAVTFGGATRTVPLTGGAAVVQLPTTGLSVGSYPVHVAYSGDPTYAPGTAVRQQLRVR